MLVFLLILILLAVLGVLGLALKIAAALILGFMIAVTTLIVAGWLFVRHQLRKADRRMQQPRANPAMGSTTVEVGEPHRSEPPPVDERY
jgi:membrane protein implicated in regulation of membrane protease activity